ncbi:MAG: Gldg family protein [Clostridiales bacterium]|nr:Gldg family protein [Clostridiales bacterium]
MKEQFKGKQFKQGSYSSVLIVIVIAIIVVINMAASQLPSQYAKLDITDNKLYSIGEQTKTLLGSLNKDVEIYFICQDGKEDENITRMLDLYKDTSSHVSVTQIDPVVNPQFAAQYTEEDVPDNSIIVTSGDTYKYISYADMYTTEVDYSTYSYQTTGYDGEGRVTSAIDYVTSDSLPKMYILEGHNEIEISSTLKDRISRENITTEALSLLTKESVPDDCDLLLINSPQSDLSESEAQMIIDYLDQGGKVFVTSNYTENDMTNFDSILNHYGLSRTEGIVVEGNANYYYPRYPSYLVPDLNSHDTTSSLKSDNRYVLLPFAQGISIGDAPREGITVDELFSTSDSAYSKVNVTTNTTIEKEDGDIDGPFAVGVAVSEPVEENPDADSADDTAGAEDSSSTDDTAGAEDTSNTDDTASAESGSETTGETGDGSTDSETEEDKEAQLVYVSTAGLLDDTMNTVVSGGNYDFFMNSISWMSKEASSVSIAEKSLTYSALMVSAGSANMWGILLIAVIPLAVLIIGIVVWVRRRKR